ncbi:MAG: transcriptional regulator [Ramlibacter sp.]|nr:transcriptional regulator [Ramlibacter sp.]
MNTLARAPASAAGKREIRLEQLPGHLFRRLHQLAVARFTADMASLGLTPIQWSALVTTLQRPGLDQITLSREIYIDTSTIAGVLDRLESRGLLRRQASPQDRRVRLLYVTEEGEALLKDANAAVLDTQEWLMEPLTPADRALFTELTLRVLKRHE